MLDKMSGKTDETRAHLTFATRSAVADLECSCRSTEDGNDDDNEKWEPFEWPMGGCDSGETVSLTLPLEKIQQQHKQGGNVSIKWSTTTTGGVVLAKSHPHKKLRREKGI